MKKRILSLIMALVIVLLCFASCGVKETLDGLSSLVSNNKSESNKWDDGSEQDDKEKAKSLLACFVVDVSASMVPLREKTVDAMRETLAQLKATGDDVKIAIIAYSSEIEYQSPEFSDGDVVNEFEKMSFLNAPDTNEAEGLSRALEELYHTKADKKQIFVFTDGVETFGGSAEIAQQISEVGIELTTVNVSHENEVQLVSVSTTSRVPYKGNVTYNVVIRSTVEKNTKIVISEEGTVVSETAISLVKGDNAITISVAPKKFGINFAFVSVEAEDDGLSGNNSLYTWYLYGEKYSTLIVDGDSDEETEQIEQFKSSGLVTLLEDYEFAVVSPSEFPATLEGLLRYDQVVLMDVDFNTLPSGAAGDLERYVSECGRSLFVSFGDNFYEMGNGADDETSEMYHELELEKILPVDLKLEGEKDTVGMVFAVDLSSSMKYLMDGRSRFELMVESVKNAIMLSEEEGGLSNEDYIGVVCFDRDVRVALEMQVLGDIENREKICEVVEWELRHYYNWYYLNPDGTESDYPVTKDDGDTYTKLGYSYPSSDSQNPRGGYDNETNRAIRSLGTSYKWAIQKVSDMLAETGDRVMLNIKQVVFVSDGAPMDAGSGYIGTVERMANGGIKTSTLSVGLDEERKQIEELMKISDAGNGNLIVAEDSDALKQAILAGVRDAAGSKEIINERDVLPKKNSYNSKVMQGVHEELEIIGGYYPSSIKEGADLVLYVDSMRPLFAEWSYGLGRVSVFMSDLGNSEWTGKLLDSPNNGLRLAYNMFTVNMNEKQGSSGIEYMVEQNSNGSFETEVVVPATLRQDEAVIAQLRNLNGDIIESVKAFQVGEKKYYACFDCEYDSVYTLELLIVNEKTGVLCDSVELAAAVKYSPEYDVLSEIESDNTLKDDEDEEKQEGEENPKILYVSKYVVTEGGKKNANKSPLNLVLELSGYTITYDDMYGNVNDIEELKGYDIYIFEGLTPQFLPTDGAVWLVDAGDAFAHKTGIVIGGEVPANTNGGYLLTENLSLDTVVTQLLNNVHLDIPLIIEGQETPAAVTKYRPITSFGASFKPIYKANNEDVFIAGNYKGKPMVVITFDFADSSLLAFVTDFMFLIMNMVEYSVK